jgi:hypothetical protein
VAVHHVAIEVHQRDRPNPHRKLRIERTWHSNGNP